MGQIQLKVCICVTVVDGKLILFGLIRALVLSWRRRVT